MVAIEVSDDFVIELVESELRKYMDAGGLGVYDEIVAELVAFVAGKAIENHRALIPKEEWNADDDTLVAGYQRVVKDNTVHGG